MQCWTFSEATALSFHFQLQLSAFWGHLNDACHASARQFYVPAYEMQVILHQLFLQSCSKQLNLSIFSEPEGEQFSLLWQKSFALSQCKTLAELKSCRTGCSSQLWGVHRLWPSALPKANKMEQGRPESLAKQDTLIKLPITSNVFIYPLLYWSQ